MSLRDQVLAAAETQQNTKNPRLRWDEWNWFYSQITASTGPDPAQFGFKRRTDDNRFLDVDPMTVDFWWDHVCTLIAGGCPEKKAPGGSSTGAGAAGNGSGGTAPDGNVFVDTLMMIIGILFAGRLAA